MESTLMNVLVVHAVTTPVINGIPFYDSNSPDCSRTFIKEIGRIKVGVH